MSESASFFEIILDLFIWLVLYFTLRPVLNPSIRISRQKIVCSYLLMMLFCLIPFFGGDFFHYYQNYVAVKNGEFTHLEGVYAWFIKNCCGSYYIFRFGVWGMALFLTLKAYKRIDVDFQLVLFFFGVIYLPWFSYARVSLAMSFIFLGLSYIAKPIKRRRVFSIILGLSLILISEVFHRSAFIGIVCALASILFRHPNRKSIFVLCILFPIVTIALSFVLNQFMNIDLGYDDFITGRHRDDYLNSEVRGGISMGLGPYIMVVFSRAPLFIIAAMYVYCVYKGYFNYFANSTKIISSYAFILIMLAFAFSFDLGYNTYTIYYRTLNFAHIPSAVFLAKLHSLGIAPKMFKLIYYSSLFGVFYTLVYSSYCALVV